MENNLSHHGIKGMKWGRRRYQNEDGSLTPAGKARVSKQYRKISKAVNRDVRKKYNSMYVNAYNKAADYMNGGGIDKFNKTQRKKYGENYAKRDGYESDYQKEFDKIFAKNFNKSLNEFYENNKNYKKGKELVDKYRMTKWDEQAKKNEEVVNEVRRFVEKNS